MIRLTLIILLLSSFTSLYSQNSKIYNPERKLIVDTSFQISEESHRLFSRYENIVMTQLYDKLYYPKIARELNIWGLVVVRMKFDIETGTEINLARGIDPHLDTLVVNQLKEMSSSFEFLKSNNVSTEYFIPVKFELNENGVIKDLDKNKSLILREYEYILYKVI